MRSARTRENVAREWARQLFKISMLRAEVKRMNVILSGGRADGQQMELPPTTNSIMVDGQNYINSGTTQDGLMVFNFRAFKSAGVITSTTVIDRNPGQEHHFHNA